MTNKKCCDRRDSVAKIKMIDRLNQFATLATRLECLNVTAVHLDCHSCHACHVEKLRDSDNFLRLQTLDGIQPCIRWITIVMEEGHLEPSQPSVDKVIGWPKRMMPIRSLWIDFIYWSRKEGISKDQMPEQWTFHGLLELFFIRHKNEYELPTLEYCRVIFSKLRQ